MEPLENGDIPELDLDAIHQVKGHVDLGEEYENEEFWSNDGAEPEDFEDFVDD